MNKIEARYNIYVTIPEFHGYKNLPMKIFKQSLTYSEIKELPKIIKGYHRMSKKDRMYVESVSEEYFTLEEIREVVPFLLNTGVCVRLDANNIPIDAKGFMGVGALPVGGLTDFLLIYKMKKYPLEINIMGYIDYRQEEAETKIESYGGSPKEPRAGDILPL